MNIYISSSWKNREQVRALAIRLRDLGHEVYDFTDPNCRKTPEIPPEKYPEQFDPSIHVYKKYINKPEWRAAVQCNWNAIALAHMIILLLPCGNDSHADWALGVGMGKYSVIIGHPNKGERSPVHLWADNMYDTIEEFFDHGEKPEATVLNTQPITDRLDQYSKALADDKGAIAFKIRLEIERHCVDDLRALLAEISILNGALDAAVNRITELEADLWAAKFTQKESTKDALIHAQGAVIKRLEAKIVPCTECANLNKFPCPARDIYTGNTKNHVGYCSSGKKED